jgi:hypothetical protein
MSDAKIDLEEFLEELVSTLDRRLKSHERAISKLERELSAARSSGGLKMDKSVLKVLRGK